eukprot:CAMPEP_0174825868 /NCGR_PEP_ID=MMETSP1107-20130205/43200_1 /TAXON_ID=36770 /ORGANISM="Paraphysomonas vestita, Strain GFlagA" /LENGTH=435 /DNA_ID=CAMNT_0016057931 /DNA_START=867 /DNA_END=2174 /DNA_ORIENTATION=+
MRRARASSKQTVVIKNTSKISKNNDGNGDGDNEENGYEEEKSNTKKQSNTKDGIDSDAEDNDENDDIDDEEQGTLKLGQRNEITGYDDGNDNGEVDDDDDDDMDEEGNILDVEAVEDNDISDESDGEIEGKSGSDSSSDSSDSSTSSGSDSSDDDDDSSSMEIIQSGSHLNKAVDEALKKIKDNGMEDSSRNQKDNDKKKNKKDTKLNSNTEKIQYITRVGNGRILEPDDNILSNCDEGWMEINIAFPAQSRKLLMVQLTEQACEKTFVRETKDISNAYAVECEISNEQRYAIQTEGVNFEAAWNLSDLVADINNIRTNDIWRVLCTYGVEAARQSIVSEISGVFGVYGINVNPRHLSLIADFMTRNGSYVPMNRMAMMDCPSRFLQMSFETTATFLTQAALEGGVETLESPSARIVTGGVPRIGTGCFDIMLPV